MKDIDLETLNRYASQEGFRNPYYSEIEKMIETIQEKGLLNTVIDREHFFYHKYLWQQEKSLELYFLSDNYIINCVTDQEGFILVNTRFKRDIINLEIKLLPSSDKDVELNTTFRNGDVITFSSHDTNESWKYKFYEEILKIYKTLIA